MIVPFLARRSERFQRFAWPVYHLVPDLLDMVPGRRDALVPSRRRLRRNFIGGADFVAVGQEFFGYFVDLAGLGPDDRVLDVGCGFGRMAIPLTKYLSARGSYEGFDILAEGVEWCAERITPRFANFGFQVADVRNPLYNPAGSADASEYRFPYDDATFDFVFLASVFTHMFPAPMEHYLSEIARVLRPGGRCLVTYFLMNDESRRRSEPGSTMPGAPTFSFGETGEGYWTTSPSSPAKAIAYDEDKVRALLEGSGLDIVEPLRYGTWSGRPDGLSFQDIVIARRGRATSEPPDQPL